MKGLMVLLGSLILAVSALPVSAQSPESDAALGERLVRQFFADLGSVTVAKGFQSVHRDGARDREAEIKTLKGLNLKNYTLANFKVTREMNVLIVTYTFAGQETIDGKKTGAEPAPRMSVFIDTGKEWQWLAHANLIPIGK